MAVLYFIHRENIKHFEKLLERTTDQVERQRIQELLAEEKIKLSVSEQEAAGRA